MAWRQQIMPTIIRPENSIIIKHLYRRHFAFWKAQTQPESVMT